MLKQVLYLFQMGVALRRATGSSLVIIDEFGKGTLTVGKEEENLMKYYISKILFYFSIRKLEHEDTKMNL